MLIKNTVRNSYHCFLISYCPQDISRFLRVFQIFRARNIAVTFLSTYRARHAAETAFTSLSLPFHSLLPTVIESDIWYVIPGLYYRRRDWEWSEEWDPLSVLYCRFPALDERWSFLLAYHLWQKYYWDPKFHALTKAFGAVSQKEKNDRQRILSRDERCFWFITLRGTFRAIRIR